MLQKVVLRLLCAGIGYVCGSVLSAELVARHCTGKSARELGTGNPGMANIMAQLGKKAGLAVLAGDVLKTVLACLLGALLAAPQLGNTAVLYAGIGAALGHNWPAWNRFRGGKGVAVTCAWLILCLPVTGTLCCLAGGAAVLVWGYLPVGALVIAVLAVPVAWVQYGTECGLVMLASALIMLSRHYRGLRRVKSGEEPRFFRKHAP